MPRFFCRCLAIAAVVVCAVMSSMLLSATRASAHNTLLSSDPADGSTLDVAPAQITWTFDGEVPLER